MLWVFFEGKKGYVSGGKISCTIHQGEKYGIKEVYGAIRIEGCIYDPLLEQFKSKDGQHK